MYNGLINSIYILGAIFGCGLFSIVKSYRRLLYCALTDVGFIVGGLCLFVYINIYLLFVGRFIQGFMAGANTVLVPMYVQEFVPKKLFSTCSVLVTFALTSG